MRIINVCLSLDQYLVHHWPLSQNLSDIVGNNGFIINGGSWAEQKFCVRGENCFRTQSEGIYMESSKIIDSFLLNPFNPKSFSFWFRRQSTTQQNYGNVTNGINDCSNNFQIRQLNNSQITLKQEYACTDQEFQNINSDYSSKTSQSFFTHVNIYFIAYIYQQYLISVEYDNSTKKFKINQFVNGSLQQWSFKNNTLLQQKLNSNSKFAINLLFINNQTISANDFQLYDLKIFNKSFTGPIPVNNIMKGCESSDSSKCQSFCQYSNMQIQQSNQHICICDTGYFFDLSQPQSSNNSCQACYQSCQSCHYFQGAAFDDCIDCKPPYIYKPLHYARGSCITNVECLSDLYQFIDSTTKYCLNVNSKFIASIQYKSQLFNLNCSSLCNHCVSDQNICLSCKEPKYLIKNNQLIYIPSNYKSINIFKEEKPIKFSSSDQNFYQQIIIQYDQSIDAIWTLARNNFGNKISYYYAEYFSITFQIFLDLDLQTTNIQIPEREIYRILNNNNITNLNEQDPQILFYCKIASFLYDVYQGYDFELIFGNQEDQLLFNQIQNIKIQPRKWYQIIHNINNVDGEANVMVFTSEQNEDTLIYNISQSFIPPPNSTYFLNNNYLVIIGKSALDSFTGKIKKMRLFYEENINFFRLGMSTGECSDSCPTQRERIFASPSNYEQLGRLKNFGDFIQVLPQSMRESSSLTTLNSASNQIVIDFPQENQFYDNFSPTNAYSFSISFKINIFLYRLSTNDNEQVDIPYVEDEQMFAYIDKGTNKLTLECRTKINSQNQIVFNSDLQPQQKYILAHSIFVDHHQGILYEEDNGFVESISQNFQVGESPLIISKFRMRFGREYRISAEDFSLTNGSIIFDGKFYPHSTFDLNKPLSYFYFVPRQKVKNLCILTKECQIADSILGYISYTKNNSNFFQSIDLKYNCLCYNVSSCSVCKQGYFLYQGKCQDYCGDKVDTSDYSCIDGGNCTQPLIYNPFTKLCVTSCQNIQLTKLTYNVQLNQCELQCPDSAATQNSIRDYNVPRCIENATQCQALTPYVHQSKCVSYCPDNYYASNPFTICSNCNQDCTKCTKSSVCDKCISSLALNYEKFESNTFCQINCSIGSQIIYFGSNFKKCSQFPKFVILQNISNNGPADPLKFGNIDYSDNEYYVLFPLRQFSFSLNFEIQIPSYLDIILIIQPNQSYIKFSVRIYIQNNDYWYMVFSYYSDDQNYIKLISKNIQQQGNFQFTFAIDTENQFGQLILIHKDSNTLNWVESFNINNNNSLITEEDSIFLNIQIQNATFYYQDALTFTQMIQNTCGINYLYDPNNTCKPFVKEFADIKKFTSQFNSQLLTNITYYNFKRYTISFWFMIHTPFLSQEIDQFYLIYLSSSNVQNFQIILSSYPYLKLQIVMPIITQNQNSVSIMETTQNDVIYDKLYFFAISFNNNYDSQHQAIQVMSILYIYKYIQIIIVFDEYSLIISKFFDYIDKQSESQISSSQLIFGEQKLLFQFFEFSLQDLRIYYKQHLEQWEIVEIWEQKVNQFALYSFLQKPFNLESEKLIYEASFYSDSQGSQSGSLYYLYQDLLSKVVYVDDNDKAISDLWKGYNKYKIQNFSFSFPESDSFSMIMINFKTIIFSDTQLNQNYNSISLTIEGKDYQNNLLNFTYQFNSLITFNNFQNSQIISSNIPTVNNGYKYIYTGAKAVNIQIQHIYIPKSYKFFVIDKIEFLGDMQFQLFLQYNQFKSNGLGFTIRELSINIINACKQNEYFNINSKSCTTSCPSSTFPNKVENFCQNCIPPCYKCFCDNSNKCKYSQDCQQCDSRWLRYLDSNINRCIKFEECPEYTYGDNDIQNNMTNKKCKVCPTNTFYVKDIHQCVSWLECFQNIHHAPNLRIMKCINTLENSHVFNLIKNCSDPNCLSCRGNGNNDQCLICKDGYTFQPKYELMLGVNPDFSSVLIKSLHEDFVIGQNIKNFTYDINNKDNYFLNVFGNEMQFNKYELAITTWIKITLTPNSQDIYKIYEIKNYQGFNVLGLSFDQYNELNARSDFIQSGNSIISEIKTKLLEIKEWYLCIQNLIRPKIPLTGQLFQARIHEFIVYNQAGKKLFHQMDQISSISANQDIEQIGNDQNYIIVGDMTGSLKDMRVHSKGLSEYDIYFHLGECQNSSQNCSDGYQKNNNQLQSYANYSYEFITDTISNNSFQNFLVDGNTIDLINNQDIFDLNSLEYPYQISLSNVFQLSFQQNLNVKCQFSISFFITTVNQANQQQNFDFPFLNFIYNNNPNNSIKIKVSSQNQTNIPMNYQFYLELQSFTNSQSQQIGKNISTENLEFNQLYFIIIDVSLNQGNNEVSYTLFAKKVYSTVDFDKDKIKLTNNDSLIYQKYQQIIQFDIFFSSKTQILLLQTLDLQMLIQQLKLYPFKKIADLNQFRPIHNKQTNFCKIQCSQSQMYLEFYKEQQQSGTYLYNKCNENCICCQDNSNCTLCQSNYFMLITNTTTQLNYQCLNQYETDQFVNATNNFIIENEQQLPPSCEESNQYFFEQSNACLNECPNFPAKFIQNDYSKCVLSCEDNNNNTIKDIDNNRCVAYKKYCPISKPIFDIQTSECTDKCNQPLQANYLMRECQECYETCLSCTEPLNATKCQKCQYDQQLRLFFTENKVPDQKNGQIYYTGTCTKRCNPEYIENVYSQQQLFQYKCDECDLDKYKSTHVKVYNNPNTQDMSFSCEKLKNVNMKLFTYSGERKKVILQFSPYVNISQLMAESAQMIVTISALNDGQYNYTFEILDPILNETYDFIMKYRIEDELNQRLSSALTTPFCNEILKEDEIINVDLPNDPFTTESCSYLLISLSFNETDFTFLKNITMEFQLAKNSLSTKLQQFLTFNLYIKDIKLVPACSNATETINLLSQQCENKEETCNQTNGSQYFNRLIQECFNIRYYNYSLHWPDIMNKTDYLIYTILIEVTEHYMPRISFTNNDLFQTQVQINSLEEVDFLYQIYDGNLSYMEKVQSQYKTTIKTICMSCHYLILRIQFNYLNRLLSKFQNLTFKLRSDVIYLRPLINSSSIIIPPQCLIANLPYQVYSEKLKECLYTCPDGMIYIQESQICDKKYSANVISFVLSNTSVPNILQLQIYGDIKYDLLQHITEYIDIEIQGYKYQSQYQYTFHQTKDPNIIKINFEFINVTEVNNGTTVVMKFQIPNYFQQDRSFIIEKTEITGQLKNFKVLTQSEKNEIDIQRGISTHSDTSSNIFALMNSLGGGTAGGYVMMLLGYIELLKFLNIEYSLNVVEVFNNIQDFPPHFVITKPIFKKELQDVQQLPEKVKEYSISPYFFDNYGDYFLQIIIFLSIGWVLNFFKKRLPEIRNYLVQKESGKASWIVFYIFSFILKGIVWNLIYILFINTYLEGCFYSILSIANPSIYSGKGKFNFLFSIVFLLVCLFFPIHIYCLIKASCTKFDYDAYQEKIRIQQRQWRLIGIIDRVEDVRKVLEQEKKSINEQTQQLDVNQKMKQKYMSEAEMDKLKEKRQKKWHYKFYNKFYEPKSQNESDLMFQNYVFLHESYCNNYYLQKYLIVFDLIRAFLIAFIIAALAKFPLIQCIINVIILVGYLVFVIIIKPFQYKYQFVLTILIEVFIIICFIISGVFAFFDSQQNKDHNKVFLLGKIIIYACMFIMIISIIFLIWPFILLIKAISKHQFNIQKYFKQRQEELKKNFNYDKRLVTKKEEVANQVSILKNEDPSPTTKLKSNRIQDNQGLSPTSPNKNQIYNDILSPSIYKKKTTEVKFQGNDMIPKESNFKAQGINLQKIELSEEQENKKQNNPKFRKKSVKIKQINLEEKPKFK